MHRRFVALFLLACIALPAQTQSTEGVRQRMAARLQIETDGRVTFRIAAPKATEVRLGGDWIEAPPDIKLVNDGQGVWSATIGPLSPDYYLYWFTVDGVPTPDPNNPYVLQRVFTVQNILHLPGAGIAFAEEKPVPHGEVRQVRYHSSSYGTSRRMQVYTPPGYEIGDRRYPVLYLLHGGGDDDSSWPNIGRAGFILDNLFAAGKAKPMIVVMPDLNKPRQEGVRPTSGTVAERLEFENELFRDLIPLVEKTYRVAADPSNRAVAGLSVGGYATLNLLAHHTESFAYFGVWSAPVEGRTVADARQLYAPLFDHPEKVNQTGKMVWLCVGDKDGGAPSVKALAEILQKHSIRHKLRVSGGAHRWTVWRHYLNEFAQELFVPSERPAPR